MFFCTVIRQQLSAQQRVLSDSRGAVLVLGVLLGSVLLAGVVGVWELARTLLWLEAAEQAVDRAALDNATWHAQGMNTLASLNLTLAAVLSCLALWRLLVVSAALATLVGLSAPTQPGTGAGDAGLRGVEHAADWLQAALKSDRAISLEVSHLAAELQAMQAAVAGYLPLLAASSPETSAALGQNAVSLSVSRLSLQTLATESERSLPARLAGDVSLPVERATQRCTTRSGNWTAPQSRWLAAEQQTWVQQRVERLAAQEASLLCAGPEGFEVVRQHLDLLLKQVAAVKPTSSQAAHWSAAEASAWLTRFERLFTGGAADAWSSALQPVQMWRPAANGNVFLRSAAVLLQGEHPAGRSRAGTLRVWGLEATTWDATLRAHAEMYFDCAANWERCAPAALWQTNWKVRLRRVSDLGPLLQRHSVVARLGLNPTPPAAAQAWAPPAERRAPELLQALWQLESTSDANTP